ncbi:Protocadherin-23, partial [Tupaia chinensis]
SQVTASDADAGLYGLVEYSLYDGFQSHEAPQAFRIDPHDGRICVTRDIDREGDPSTYDLLVKAKDGGGLSAQAFVRVELEDVNDNHPVFNPSAYETSLSGQTQPGTEIIGVFATDRDSGTHGAVTYELVPGDLSSLFTIDPTTGIIYLTSSLSHLEPTSFVLVVSARDGGGLPAVTKADVTVHILQTSLAPAEFERPKYTFLVYEDVPEDSLVGTVKAREPLNSSEPVHYRISSGDLDGMFSIHPWLGTIRTRQPLDHEAMPAAVLTVEAQLGGAPAYSSAEVNVTVLDVNDNAPAFLTASDEIWVSAATRLGAALYLAHAEDRDSGPNGCVRYALAGPSAGCFTVHPELGVLSLNCSLAGHLPQRHVLTLLAQDLGVPPRASRMVLTVVVEAQERSPPLTFDHLLYRVDVSESLPPRTLVLQTQASPLGPRRPAPPPRYALQPGRASAAFGIRADTGWVYLRRQLDYEAVQTYSLKVLAWTPEDGPARNASASVIVRVLDDNDNAPAFLQDALFLKVQESSVPRGVIARVTALDTDSGRNGRLSYFLLSDREFFKMNPSTGELINWVALDREAGPHHQMTVLVRDHGSPPRNATMEVHVSVTDINDNRPAFPQCLPEKELHVKVLEGQPVNMLVTTVFAKDPDEGNNAEVIYSISPEGSSDHFKIDANSGEIRTTTTLSYDYRPFYKVTVIASDQGVPPLQGQAVINIQVIPLSKGRTIMSQNIRHLVIPENLKPAKIMSLLKSPGHLHQHPGGELHFRIVADDKGGPFEIDSSTGDLFLSKELDYEAVSHYLFRVVTTDHSRSPPLSSTVFLSVDVEDQNDHSPSFLEELVVIGVEENVPPGTLVEVFNAKDGDGSFLNSRVQYGIESHHPGVNPFLIHPSSGTLVTASTLDREQVPSVTLTVTASDQAVNVTDRRLSTLLVKVVILDVNDHSPAFTSAPAAHVREDVTAGALVHHITAQDPDEGRNGQVTYSILSGNEDRAFTLDASSGLLTTARALDYEVQAQHVLTVLARDSGSPARSSSQTLTVTVLDVNDEAPVFLQTLYEASVKENQNPGQFVTRVEAMDRDSGINSKLRFEILPGSSFGFFEINSDTGEVVTAATLDREAQEAFTLRVLVRDGGVPSLSSTATILCTVDDENDHVPVFVVPRHDLEVLENQEPELVYTALAFDRDAGNNGAIRYRILDGNTGEYFAIDATSGALSTARALDREHVGSFTLVIQGSDLGEPPRSSAMRVQVRVLDTNDHSPSFPTLHYLASLREDAGAGTEVLALSAVDQDEGLSGQVEYFLTEEALGTFAVDPVTGTLSTCRALDREARSQHTFGAVARDRSAQGPRSTTVLVTVYVTDVNDNDPVWEQNPWDVFLSPGSPVNQTAVILRASDPDLGPNGTVTFSFAETQSVFSIDEHTGEVRLEQNPSPEYFPIWLRIKAVDRGTPARTATGLLVVRMEGGEEQLSFSHHLYQGRVTEDCVAGASGESVGGWHSGQSGKPEAGGIPGGPKCMSSDSELSVPGTARQLTVQEPKLLDFEVRHEMQLVVLAECGRHRAYSTVAILIQDVNDNLPRFEQSAYHASVPEGQFYNTRVLQVFATDQDSGLNGLVEYSIVSGNREAAFQIDALSGVITANAILDYESVSNYSLIVQATDKGMPRLSATTLVKIQVTDRNDHAPVFLPSEAVEISESAAIGVVVTRVSVHDADLNPAFVFSFANEGNPGAHFAIDRSTGEVVLVKTLDFEEATEHKLLVQISDSLHLTEGALAVRVLDANDNPPEFHQDFYQGTVPESAPVGYSVLTVSAADVESSGNISYRILPPSQDFSIDPMSGAVFTVNPTLLLDKISTVQFLVEACDGGLPELRAVMLVEIEIQDVNDHAPEFTATSYDLSVSEDTPIGRTLLTLSTVDHDWTPENTHVEYSIVSGDPQSHFRVEGSVVHAEYPHEQVGYLVLLDKLDREVAASHKLVVLASDGGCPPLSSTAVVSIRVLDVNDSPPEFSSPSHHAHVRESTPPGSPTTVVSARDRDTGPHAEVFYRIISGNEKGHFLLEEKTGVLYVSKALDYEDTVKFRLTVQASDEEKQLSAFAVVAISVLDDNDHAPQFLSSHLTCVIPENQPVSSTVCAVNAVDFDTGPYGELTYSLLSPCFVTHGVLTDPSSFLIDPLTGEIQAKRSLDYEQDSRYCLTVQAKDKGDLTASLTVWVDVEGIDEFEPIFTQEQYYFDLPEGQKTVRQSIGRVEAVDADAGVDGVVVYSLGAPSPFFAINNTSGNIYLIRALPLIRSPVGSEDTIEMEVIARSPKPDSRFASCTVFVNVSFSAEGGDLAVPASSFSISLAVSFLVFLSLVCTLIMLLLRHKQKDPIDSDEREKGSSLDIRLRLAQDASLPHALQKTGDCGQEAVPAGSAPEWLSLLRMVEKDIAHLYRHPNSSGRCSVEAETAEDQEIQRINEHPYTKDSDSPLSDRESRVPDSGIPRDSDQLSCLSGDTDVLVTGDTADASHMVETGLGCSTACVPSPALPQALPKTEPKEDVLAGVRKGPVFISAREATPPAHVTAEHAAWGSYSWDHLLSWEPKFQPLASVFNDIAGLKDEQAHRPGALKEKVLVFPPPLITAVAQPGIKAVPPRMPATAPRQVPHKYPRSPVLCPLGAQLEAVTPSFSPSLSLLTVQTPVMPLLLSEAEFLGTHVRGTCQELRAEDEVQI